MARLEPFTRIKESNTLIGSEMVLDWGAVLI